MPDGYNKSKDNSFTQTLFEVEEENETSPKQYEFKACSLDDIKDFMIQHHYSRSANVAAMYCFALVSKTKGVVGAAIYSKPAMNSIYKLYADSEDQVVELRRLVCIDATPKNTESYFVGKTLRWLILNTNAKTVVTYADPSFGHVGHAYRACNMIYDGVSGTTVVLEIPIDKCVHEKQSCIAEGKKACQVHDRNMRCKIKGGDEYTPQAIRLRMMHKEGIAKLVPRDAKHRYHYHLEEHRTNKPQVCRQCNEMKPKEKPKKELPNIKEIKLVEKSDDYIPEGYNADDNTLEQKIEKGWSKETSFWPDKWTAENAACGQCAVTALIIQEKKGGDLLRTEVEGFGSHYYNRLPDGSIIDLTKKQFPQNATMSKPSVKKRDDILQYKSVAKRYEELKKRIGE